MKSLIKPIFCATIATALAAGIQMTSFATLDTDTSLANPDQSAVSTANHASTAASEHLTSGAVSDRDELSRNELARGENVHPDKTTAEANEIQNNTLGTNEIPNTGAENIAIPSIVALIAAATAAITLTGKKK